MTFLGIGDHESDPHRARRRRPRVFAWQLRWRLLIVVAIGLLLPSLAIQFVPGLRRWAGLEVATLTQPALSEGEIANEDVETRLLPSGLLPSEGPQATAPGEFSTDALKSHASPLQVAMRDRWLRLRNGLDATDRSRLHQALKLARDIKLARDRQVLTDVERSSWEAVLLKIDNRWNELNREATEAITDLPEDEKAKWSRVIEQLDASWKEGLRPLLVATAGGQQSATLQQQKLVELQLLLDDLALADVLDNTIIRSAEADAWFRCFEQLQSATPLALKAEAIGRIGFLPLFKQPQMYRGKLVTVRGDLRLGYRVAAQANHCGIEEYYVYWLKPAGGPNRPIVIYALETLPGFPKLADKELGQAPTELDIAAEVTGYFFKNWAYPAQDHTRVAPLLLARAPELQPVITARRSLPSGKVVTGAVLASIIFAVAFACFVYYKSQPPPRTARGFDFTLK